MTMDLLSASLNNLDLGTDRQGGTGKTRVELQSALKTLQAQSQRLSSQVGLVEALVSGNDALFEDQDTPGMLADLQRAISQFRTLELELNEACAACARLVQRVIISGILSLGNADPLRQEMVKSFEAEINSISHEILMETGNTSDTIRLQVVEKCYFETLRGGKLDGDNYFGPRHDAALGWPYDPDYESEQYYEHEDRLDIDENYRESFRKKCDRRLYEAHREEESWTRYWLGVLQACPSGPTLFDIDQPLNPWTPEMSGRAPSTSFELGETPRFLFRIFDKKSAGLNNKTIIASQASFKGDPGSRVDILSLNSSEAADLLHRHLDQMPYGAADDSDNLVSWTTSFLFAIQYAIWRQHQHGIAQKFIFLCVIDTEKFPRGQFVQDLRLIQAYKHDASDKAKQFFKLRTDRLEYYNGEFLSQGSLRHSGRGCVVSLEALINSGLYGLYPEFTDPEGFYKWTKRVMTLRQQWGFEKPLRREDLDKAARIAKDSFGDFGGIEMVLMLVCFKARTLTSAALNRTSLFSFISVWLLCSHPRQM